MAARILGKLKVNGWMEEVKEMERRNGGRGGRLQVRLGNIEVKKEIMWNKKKLKGETVWIEDDLTEGGKRMQWKFRRIGEEEGRKKRNVWVGYGKIKINGEVFWWDERKDTLRDGRGEQREERGEEKEGKADGEEGKQEVREQRNGETNKG